MYASAGSVQIVPVHAIVSTLSFPLLSVHVTNTAGSGYTIFPGFQICLLMANSFYSFMYASKNTSGEFQ